MVASAVRMMARGGISLQKELKYSSRRKRRTQPWGLAVDHPQARQKHILKRLMTTSRVVDKNMRNGGGGRRTAHDTTTGNVGWALETSIPRSQPERACPRYTLERQSVGQVSSEPQQTTPLDNNQDVLVEHSSAAGGNGRTSQQGGATGTGGEPAEADPNRSATGSESTNRQRKAAAWRSVVERGSPGGKGGERRTVAEGKKASKVQNAMQTPDPQSVRAVADDAAPVNAEVPLGKKPEKATPTAARGEEETGPRWEIQKDGRWLRAKIEEAATGQTRKPQGSRGKNGEEKEG